MAVLEAAPYYLTHGSLIIVRGKAFNNNGWAVLWSDPNTTGATIIASAPIMNTPYVVNESPSEITVAWSNPASTNSWTGGSVNQLPFGTKYELMWDGGQNAWSEVYIGTSSQKTIQINQALG
jgi:hypothetical protein